MFLHHSVRTEKGSVAIFNLCEVASVTLKTSLVAEKGSTAKPTSRSATASDTMNRLVTLRSFDEHSTAAITRQFPGDNCNS